MGLFSFDVDSTIGSTRLQEAKSGIKDIRKAIGKALTDKPVVVLEKS